MLNEKQMHEIREWLEKSQNPVFFFDNDTDGLASFLLLQRFIGRGKGVAIKSFPELTKSYLRKVQELKPDVVFILDKPLVDQEFFDGVKEYNIPIIWIDHHELQKNTEGIHYYNPRAGKPQSSEPVSYWCYKTVKRDLWIGMIGCLGDWFSPEFLEEFRKKYPELLDGKKKAEEILYETRFGKLIQMLNFALRDRTSNVVRMLRVLETTNSPNEIFSEEKKYESIIKRYNQLNRKFEKFFEKASESAKKADKVIFFQYSGDMKLSSELSNKLMYKWPGKIIIVAYVHEGKASISLRGKKVRDYLEKALEKSGGRGGGHEEACAANIKSEDLHKFVEEIRKQAQ